MSFEVVCTGCGAPSGPSVGICPFCKSVMASASAGSKEKPVIDALTKLYVDGKLERALHLGSEMHRSKADLRGDLAFVLTFVKILIESEAPSSKIRSVLSEAQLLAPQNIELSDYQEIVEAKNLLKQGADSTGEIMLRNLLRRSPSNLHAHFVLAAHLFWTDQQPIAAIPHLETCVRLHPNFLRAWGCLGAIYKKLENHQLAQLAFQKCASLETNQNMKDFFLSQAKAA